LVRAQPHFGHIQPPAHIRGRSHLY
jgi:hypothetical protein